ncbi:MAG: hypothetical protein HQ481_03160 [Alphaproteobacteria bacterium]|nr:hypothetical protein [Alphaproteobacteria bacterium]
MRLIVARVVVLVLIAAVMVAGVWSRLSASATIERHRDRVLELCTIGFGQIADVPSLDTLRSDKATSWSWGVYEMPSRVFNDRLPHDTETFAAVRVSRRDRLVGSEGICRIALCVYSIPLGRATALVNEQRCGGAGAEHLVPETLKPDILRAR